MVEVDPAILVAGSTAIAALVGVVVCMSANNNNNSSSKNTTKETPAPKKEAKAATAKSKKSKEKKAEKKEEKKVEKKEPSAPVSKKKVAKVVEEAPPAPKPTPPTPPAVEEEPKTSKKAKETPEQRAARLERQKIAKQKKADEAAAAALAKKSPAASTSTVTEPVVPSQQSQISDGWAVVEDRRKKKPKPVEVKAPTVTEDETVQATSSVVTEQVMVDAKKIGGIIGPKGVTLHAIQDMNEVKIDTPKDRDGSSQVAVTVSGSGEGVAAAIKIIKELNTKGYSKALEGENFNESAISVKHSYLSDLIGKNGSCIRAMQDKTGVKISIPPNSDAKSKVRIGLAGSPEGIIEVKSIMGEIMTYFHSEVTHPGVIHQTMDVPERMYNMIIGSRGAEIKHIQNNFKVNVHIPNAESTIKDVLIVGQRSGVDGAMKYIEKIVSNLTQEEAKAESIAETWNEQQTSADETTTDGDEPWMNQYSYNRDKKVSLISKDGADLLQKAQANAWKESTSAEGW
mmetsp:Transcript_24652/g.45950  ORF Transcript_24652/g.45950 Transcript_24652/m.45950 type:complete len:512 (+) Transcript_24652:40-1575(+)